MITIIDLVNYGFAAVGLTVAIMSLFLSFTTTYISRQSKLFFKIFFQRYDCLYYRGFAGTDFLLYSR